MTSANDAEYHWEKIPVAFETPEELWEQACNYFRWCLEHPLEKSELLRAGARTGDTATYEVARPITAAGLCIHTGITMQYLKEMTADPTKGMWHQVCQRIYLIMLTDTIEKALAGIYNAPFTTKFLKLDKEDVAKTNPVININVIAKDAPPMLTEEQSAKEQ